jgi:polyphosphate kinase
VLVVREEPDGIRRYAHIATGNYNSATARLYEDFGLLSCDPELGIDLTQLFNHLTGYSREVRYHKLLVAPRWMRHRFQDLVANEAAYGRDGRILMKMNALVDPAMIESLYQASSAGVQIELVVRGICCLRPGIPGLSENIRVRSVVGRYLEHSRIFVFGNGNGVGRPLYLTGSADLMPRNLDGRVEVVTPIDSPEHQSRLRETLDAALSDSAVSWTLNPDGSWVRTPGGSVDIQRRLYEAARQRARRGSAG